MISVLMASEKEVLTMTEYITLEQAAAAFAIQSVFSTSDCLDALHYAIQKGWISPSDVTPVRHAKWVDNHCTACGMMPMGDEMWKKYDCDPPLFDRFMDYCPSCGAKMDGGAD